MQRVSAMMAIGMCIHSRRRIHVNPGLAWKGGDYHVITISHKHF